VAVQYREAVLREKEEKKKKADEVGVGSSRFHEEIKQMCG
jgi:hypothetical protein